MSEKRRFVRFDVEMGAIGKYKDALRKIKINNFCREGIGIESNGSFSKGEILDMEMMIPGDNVPVFFEGEVAWTDNPGSHDKRHESGLKFKRISNEDRGRMLEFIYKKWIMPKGEKSEIDIN